MARFFRPPPWRFLVTDLNTQAITLLDRLAHDVRMDIDLNTPARLMGSVPSASPEINILHTDGDPFLAEGNRLLYAFRRDEAGATPWECRLAGPILAVDDDGDPNAPTTQFTMFDPWQLLFARRCVDEFGNEPGELGLNFLNGTAPTASTNWEVGMIALFLLKWAIDATGSVGIDAGNGSRIGEAEQYQNYSGTAFFNGFLAATDEMEWNVQRGKTVGEAWEDLCATDKLDIALKPVYDPVNRPGYTAEVDLCAQPPVTGQSRMKERENAIFSFDKPPRSLSSIRRSIDGRQRANRVVFYTRYGVVDSVKNDVPSQTKYGVYEYEQAFPDMELATDQIARWAEGQLKIRKNGIRDVIPIPNPQQPPEPFVEFNIGDLVPVYASNRLRQAIPGPGDDPYMRLFGFTLEVAGAQETERLTEVRVSKDGISA